jgi:hypothetical protein
MAAVSHTFIDSGGCRLPIDPGSPSHPILTAFSRRTLRTQQSQFTSWINFKRVEVCVGGVSEGLFLHDHHDAAPCPTAQLHCRIRPAEPIVSRTVSPLTWHPAQHSASQHTQAEIAELPAFSQPPTPTSILDSTTTGQELPSQPPLSVLPPPQSSLARVPPPLPPQQQKGQYHREFVSFSLLHCK